MWSKHSRRKKKQYTQRMHAKRRMAQRFSISLNREDYKQIVGRIRAGKYEVLCRQSLRVTAYSAVIQGRPMVLIYDHKRRNLVTVLRPDEYIERRIQKEEGHET